MSEIYRYAVPVNDRVVKIDLAGEIVHVGGRSPAAVEFWAVHHNDGVSRPRWFTVVGTGHELPPDFIRVIGSVVHAGPGLVWHLIEVQERL